jgi:Domain of unknown function (DUF4410)
MSPQCNSLARRWSVMLLVIAMTGCASTTTTPPATPAPTSTDRDTVPYRADPHLQKVWLAEGFSVQRHQSLLVLEPRTDVAKLNPDGVENLRWARGLLRDEVVKALRAKRVFPAVALTQGEVAPGTRPLRLETTIIEYEKGGGGARFFAGAYGAGQPVIRVRGRVIDGERPVFAFDARRSGDSGLSRAFGGYRGDRAIQEEDIRDLASDLAEFLIRNASHR